MKTKNCVFFLLYLILHVISARQLACMTLFEASEQGAYAQVHSLACQQSVNMSNELGLTALHIASIHGHADLVGLLLHHRAVTLQKDPDGMTALHHAATNHRLAVVEKLLAHRADPNEQDDSGMSPLHVALTLPERILSRTEAKYLEKSKYSIVNMLILNGANVDFPINARQKAKPSCLLLGYTKTCYDGYSPLNYLLSQKWSKYYQAIARILMAHGANIHTAAADGTEPLTHVQNVSKFNLWYTINYPLHEAIIANDSYCVSRLLLHGYKPEDRDYFGKTAVSLVNKSSNLYTLVHLHDVS